MVVTLKLGNHYCNKSMREGETIDTNLINKDSFLHLGGVLDTLLNHIAGKLVLGEVEHFAADAVH